MDPLSSSQLNQPLIPERMGSTADLCEFISQHKQLFVITGAGISHASGIPTYRDEIGTWKGNTPIQHGDFLSDAATRRRYWARSFKGWPTVSSASPNASHRALARLEECGVIQALVTQNIDRLHQKAGHRRVTDLHGRLDEVICMDCGVITPRSVVQGMLEQLNPHFAELEQELLVPAPDGDADVSAELVDQVIIPECPQCRGMLKPNVVFYGGSVHKEKVNYLYEQLQQANGLLVVGSSLMVYSSFRFCKFAAEARLPMACVNKGLTRADGFYQLKLDDDCGEVLNAVAETFPAKHSAKHSA